MGITISSRAGLEVLCIQSLVHVDVWLGKLVVIFVNCRHCANDVHALFHLIFATIHLCNEVVPI